MKALFMSALLLATACSSDSPAPKMIRPTVELVAVTVTGLAPLTTRPDLSVRIGQFTSSTIASAALPARFWIPGSYKGNQAFRVEVLNKGVVLSSVGVDPQQFAGSHRFNIGEGSTDLTIELSF